MISLDVIHYHTVVWTIMLNVFTMYIPLKNYHVAIHLPYDRHYIWL